MDEEQRLNAGADAIGKLEQAHAAEVERANRARVTERELAESRTELDAAARHAGELDCELQRLRNAERPQAEELQSLREQLATARSTYDSCVKTEEFIRSNLQQVQKKLSLAIEENQLLRRRKPISIYEGELGELLLHSDANIQRLKENQRDLEAESLGNRVEQSFAEAQTKALASKVEALEARLQQEIAIREESERRVERSRRYADHYPGIGSAAEFFAESIYGDEYGALPPFDNLSGFCDLGSDPFANRFEATHPEGACTLRVIGRNSLLGAHLAERAWEIETTNIKTLLELGDRKGLARILLAPDELSPGFVAFERPNCPCLLQYGERGLVLGLVPALRFVNALMAELAARDQQDIVASWPDLRALAVCGGLPLLLEPSATHFGDLGPPDMTALSADDNRKMNREEIESAWNYVLAHAFLRTSGLWAVNGPAVSRTAVTERGLRLKLEDLRRACDAPVDLDSLRALASVLPQALDRSPSARPPFERTIKAFRALL